MRNSLLVLLLLLFCAPLAEAQFLSDTFTGSSGTELSLHTGETGATWTQVFGVGFNGLVLSDTNRVRSDDAATHLAYYASGVPASADYDVSGVIHQFSITGYMGVAGRMGTSEPDATKYTCELGDGNLYLQVHDSGGTPTTLGTYAASTSNGNDYTVKLEMRGTAIKCYLDGVQRISVTDSTIVTAGRAGIFAYDVATNSTGFHLDSMTASDPVSASTPCHRSLLGVGC